MRFSLDWVDLGAVMIGSNKIEFGFDTRGQAMDLVDHIEIEIERGLVYHRGWVRGSDVERAQGKGWMWNEARRTHLRIESKVGGPGQPLPESGM